MTTEQKLQILRDATDRAYETIAKTSGSDMASPEFHSLLYTIDRFNWMENGLTEGRPPFESEARQPEPEKPAKPKPVETESTPEPVKPAEEKPTKPDGAGTEVKIDSGTMRGALSRAQVNGVNVAEIIRKFGAKSFTALRPDTYPAIMEALKEAEKQVKH